MPILALLMDGFTFAAYLLQRTYPSRDAYFFGIVFQGLMVFLLMIFLFVYKGKRYGAATPQSYFGHYRNFSLRYTVMVLSFLLNAIVLFLYTLNFLDINPLIFTN